MIIIFYIEDEAGSSILFQKWILGSESYGKLVLPFFLGTLVHKLYFPMFVIC